MPQIPEHIAAYIVLLRSGKYIQVRGIAKDAYGRLCATSVARMGLSRRDLRILWGEVELIQTIQELNDRQYLTFPQIADYLEELYGLDTSMGRGA